MATLIKNENVTPQENDAKEEPHFFPCCPCIVTLDERACTPPWCWTYRYLDWILTVALVGVSWWGTLWVFLGVTAAPGGPFFVFSLISVVAYAVGWFGFYHLHLPPSLGMVTVAVLYRNTPLWNVSEQLDRKIKDATKSLLMTISLIKGGLYFDGTIFKSKGLSILVIGLVPSVIEVLTTTLTSYALLELDMLWAIQIGTIMTGVSPALVSLGIVALANQGYGAKSGMLTIMLAASTIDNKVVIIAFSVADIILQEGPGRYDKVLLNLFLQVVGSLVLGFVLGLIIAFIPNRYHRNALMCRFFLLLTSCSCVYFVCWRNKIHTAAYLACLAEASVMVNIWRITRCNEDAAAIRELFEMLWHACQPVIIMLVGMGIDFSSMKPDTTWKAFVIFFFGFLARALATYGCTVRTKHSRGQRLFMAVTWMTKGLLQVGLETLAWDTAQQTIADTANRDKLVEQLTTCTGMSIFLGSFLGVFLMMVVGQKVLPKPE